MRKPPDHFAGALILLDKIPNCASDDQVADFLLDYALLLNLLIDVKKTLNIVQRYLARVDRLDNDPRAVLIRHHYIVALIWNARYREAAAVQQELLSIADRLGDNRSRAYALATDISVSTIIAPKSLHEFESLKGQAISLASKTADAYIQNWIRIVIGYEEFHRGRILHARQSATELMNVGRALNDPRSTGLGLWLLSWIAIVSDSYAEALEFSEQSLAVAITPVDRMIAINGKGCALVLLRRVDEGAALLDESRRYFQNMGHLYALAGSDGAYGVCEMLRGNIADGLRWIEEVILRRETEGYLDAGDWYRLLLSELYLQIIAGKEKLPLKTLLPNMPIH